MAIGFGAVNFPQTGGAFGPSNFLQSGQTQVIPSAVTEKWDEKVRMPFGGTRTIHHQRRGYALDLNGDGRYTKGQDGVLAFDLNGDGKVSGQEIHKSRAILMSLGGNYDFSGDGKVTAEETARGHELAGKYSQMFDLNHDGTLEAGELQRAGARVLVDSNRNGKFENAESQTINNLPSIGYGRASLDYVNPFMANGSVSNRGAWF
ncbi:MAG: hypothetical protein U0931_15515 [Vulcanimicrobiota bacterium]